MDALSQVNWGAVGAIVGVLGVLFVFVGVMFRIGHWVRGLEERFKGVYEGLGRVERHLDEIGSRVNRVEDGLGALLLIHRQELLDFYRLNAPPAPGNYYTLAEREQFLDKLQAGTITRSEALRFREILQEEHSRLQQELGTATSERNLLAVVAIGALLLLLVYVLSNGN